MLLDKLLDLYEQSDEYAKRRHPGTGNPTGSALGKCAAALQLLRWPAISNPEPLSARAIMGFEEGDDVERRMLARAKKVYGENLVGFAQAVAYWSVPVTREQALLITERMAMAYKTPGAVWGRVVRGFRPPRVRVREGRSLITPSYPIMTDRKTGFVLDPEAEGGDSGLLWVPIQIDFSLSHPELGPHIAEIKAVSEYEFRRALLGELSYQKRAQLAAMVDATGLPAFWIIQRKNTQHVLEISYSPSVIGKVRVKLLLNTRREEVFFVDGPSLVRETGNDALLPPDEEWTFGEVWTPYDPVILAECRERVVRVLTWDPTQEPYREYGPAPFTCEKCRGAGKVVCKQCKGIGETPKTKKPCGPCGGAKTVACEPCGASGQVAERTLPPMPCSYCSVKVACFAKAGVEKRFVVSRFGQRPAWVIGREAWKSAALPIHTPPSLRGPDLDVDMPMVEAGAPAQLALPGGEA